MTKEQEKQERQKKLQEYVKRLSEGEDLESVRADFVSQFSNVSALEIAQAEQQLLENGTSLKEVQKLCDVHSALFHGATQLEKMMSAGHDGQEETNEKDRAEQNEASPGALPHEMHFDDAVAEKVQTLSALPGHPLYLLTKENEAMTRELARMETILKEAGEVDLPDDVQAELEKLREVGKHYGKKGELIYPLLSRNYDVKGPSSVMWGVDIEIRDALGQSAKALQNGTEQASWMPVLKKTMTRMQEMIYKERNILYPLCAQYFTEEEWLQIYRDLPDFGYCLIQNVPSWDEGEAFIQQERKAAAQEGRVVLPTGTLQVAQLEAMLNTMPYEITFIDADDLSQYFNDGPGTKLFPRPLSALGTKVYECHPPKAEPMVHQLISDFKAGTRDLLEIFIEKGGEPVRIRYMAVRDDEGRYLGAMELVEPLGAVLNHFKKTAKES